MESETFAMDCDCHHGDPLPDYNIEYCHFQHARQQTEVIACINDCDHRLLPHPCSDLTTPFSKPHPLTKSTSAFHFPH